MQSLVSRTLNPIDNAVVSFTEFHGNGTVNVVPGQVVLKGDTRSLTSAVQSHIEATMQRIVSGICGADFWVTLVESQLAPISPGKAP